MITTAWIVACAPWAPPPDRETSLTESVPVAPDQVLVVPDTLWFEVAVSDTNGETRSFQVINGTSEATSVFGHTSVDGDVAFVVDGVAPVVDLGPGDTLEVPVRFTPTRDGAYAASITVSDTWVVSLTGQGDAPRLTADAADAGDVPVGAAADVSIRLGNVGHEPLQLTILDESLDGFERLGEVPTTVDPGLEVPVAYRFTPYRTGVFVGLLRLETNDPDHPTFAVGVYGTGVEPASTKR
jgi:hypothetical protein